MRPTVAAPVAGVINQEKIVPSNNPLRLFIALICLLLGSCSGGGRDFCEYLSVAEARSYDPEITQSEMRQTENILYCVYRSNDSDRLLISLDEKLHYPPAEFLEVLARNSPEENDKIVSLSSPGIESAALFLGDGEKTELEFLVAQNSRHSVIMRAPTLTSTDTGRLEKLKEFSVLILSSI
jgi:hypothetical protein